MQVGRQADRQADRQAGMLQLTIAGFCDCEGQVESPDSQSQGCSKTEGDAKPVANNLVTVLAG